MDKIGRTAVGEELKKAGFGQGVLKKIEKQQPTPRLKEIFSVLESFGIDKKFYRFDPFLARGLDYYTGMIYEITVPGASGSLSGGGRYDNLIGIFSGEKIPAVGGSFGLDRLTEFVPAETLQEIPFKPRVLVTVFSPEILSDSIALFDRIQGEGIESEIYLDPTAKLEKQLKYADRKEIPYAVIIGPQELKNKKVILRDLRNRTQQSVGIELLSKAISG